MVLGATVAAATALVPVAVPQAAVAVAQGASKPANWWGWGYHTPAPDGEWVHGPFDTREAALADARAYYDDEAFEVSECHRQMLCDADYKEIVFDWLTEGGQLQIMLADGLVRWNEEYQFEDEAEEEIMKLPLWRAAWDLEEYVIRFVERTGLFFDIGEEFVDHESEIVRLMELNLFFEGEVKRIVKRHIPEEFYGASKLLKFVTTIGDKNA